MDIITTNRDEEVYADLKMSYGESETTGYSGKKYKIGPYNKRGEWGPFINMHNLTEKEIRKEIRHRLGYKIWPQPKITIFRILLKGE